MNRDQVKGAADKAKGAIEDTAGEIIGDAKLQAEGKLDKAKGAAHSAVGDVKDAVKRSVSEGRLAGPLFSARKLAVIYAIAFATKP
jgi:uncharacterized protein YjbJ (UPF0337 family)